MRTLILYFSKTGSTKKYAEDMAASLKCDVLPFQKFKKKMIPEYDTIVFGSRVVGSKIQKLDDFLAMYDAMAEKNVILFAVGMSIVTKQTRLDLITANLLDLYHVRFYQLRGSFDFNKLGFVEKMMLNNSLRLIANDPNAGADKQALLSIKDHPVEWYDHEGVNKIISVVNKISTVVAEA